MSGGRPSSWSSRLADDVAEHRRAGRRRGLGRPSSVRDASSSRRSTPGPLLGDDLVELAPDVAEHVVELVALEHLLAPALEPIHQVAQAGHVAAGRVAGPPAAVHQPAERLGEVALGHDVVGERVEDLVGVEVGDCWLPSQRRVARRPGERVAPADSAARDRRSGRAGPPAPDRADPGSTAVTGGRPSRRGRGPC